jgi:hypothetical protein
VVELPKPPWYRRFGVVFLAANLVVAAVLVAAVVALWPRSAGQRPVAPATTAGVGRQAGQLLPEGPEPAVILPTSTRVRLEPGVLWQRRGSAGSMDGRFAAPGRWRVVWSFNCQSFAKYGGGNFKWAGDFAEVSVQRFGVRGRGVLQVTGGGRGRLTIESVCDRWTVKAVAP